MLELTKEDLMVAHKHSLEKLLTIAHNYYYLAKMLDVPPSTAQGWVARGRISKEGAKRVETHKTLGKFFIAKDLRPELK